MKFDPKVTDPVFAVQSWVRGRFVLRSGFYAGRPPSNGDLNSKILEMFYKGIKKDVGGKQASNFVRFVNQLTDLSASSFVIAFMRFWSRECEVVEIHQNAEDRITLSGRVGEGLEAESLGLIGAMLGHGGNLSPASISWQSRQIKASFIQAHLAEIPEDEREEKGKVEMDRYHFR